MAILGRSQPQPAIVSRSDPRDFAATRQPVDTIVKADPYARIWFKGPQAIVVVNNPATFATTSAPPIVVTPANKAQLTPEPIISQAPPIQAAPVFTATPAPVVVVPVTPRQLATVIVTENPLPPAPSAQPLVVTSPQRPGLTTPAILSRSPQAPLPLATVGIPAPVVYTPTVPKVWARGAIVILFPRGTTNPLPPPGDLDVCIQTPVTSWIMGDVFTNTCEAGAPITNWVVGTSSSDCESPIVGTNWIMQAPVEDC